MLLTVKLRLVWNTMRGWEKFLPIIVLAVSSFLLMVGGNLERQLLQERGEACELHVSVTAGTIGGLAEKLADLCQWEGVKAVTLAGEAELLLSYGEYQSRVTFCGVDPSYLQGEWQQGQVYAEKTAMPYVVLNVAAIKSFYNEKKISLEQPEIISWCESEITVEKEIGARPIRICGVIDDGEEDARAYLSRDQLQILLSAIGWEDIPPMLWVRLENVGYRERVCRQLQLIGVFAEMEDERESGWQLQEERRNLYFLIGILVGICGCFIHFGQENLRSVKQQQLIDSCRQKGYPSNLLPMLSRWHFIMIVLFGVAAGSVSGMIYFCLLVS